MDQMLSAYPIERKQQKEEFRNLLNMCILNAHTIHLESGGKMTSLEFREHLVGRIVAEHMDDTRKDKKGRPSNDEDPLRLLQRHFPDYVQATDKKQVPMKRCVVCSKNNVWKESRYPCAE